MGNRPTDWHVLDLDRDPVPGDPYEVKELARKLGDFADDVSSALRSVKGLSGNNAVQDWAGLAADAYREQFGDLPGELTKLEKSYRLASGALETYWPKLETAQADADRALAQGRTARQDLDAAKTTQTNANDWVKRAGDKSKEYQADPKPGVEPPSAEEVRTATRNALDASNAQKSANTAVHDAQQRLDAAKELAAQAAHLRDTAASTAEHALHEASDAGIKNKHWWEKAVDWVADHWDEIVAVCKVIVAVLGIIVMIIGGPLAWIVLAAALVVLADTLIKYAQGKASLWDVFFAALDCIPGFKGLTTAGGLLKMAKNLPALLKSGKALENIANSVRKGAGAIRDAGRTIKSLFTSGDPIDMATGEMVMSATDVSLPGILPLAIERHHRSAYRGGRWFGKSWASTLDQRLWADDQGVRYTTEDGMVLHYPVPQGEGAVLPVEGPRWPLRWDGSAGGSMTILRPQDGRTLHFRPLPGRDAAQLPLTAVTDRHDNCITIEYASDGSPREISHSGGYRLTVEASDDRITALLAFDGRQSTPVMRYGYDGSGNLSEIADASAVPLKLTYDDRRRITGWQDRHGTRYQYTYDGQGRCVRTAGSEGILDYVYVYDDETHTTLATNSLGFTTTYQFNAERQLIRETDPLGNATVSEWDRYDRLLHRTDPLGRTTRYAYDRNGRCTGITYSDGAAATIGYDAEGQPVLAIDPEGAQATQRFDTRGNLVGTTDPGGATVAYGHDEHGGLSAVTDALGVTRTVRTDRAGLTVEVIGPQGDVTRYTRDSLGRIVEATDATGGVTSTGWTTDGKPAWRRRPDGSTERWEYNEEGDLIAYQDPAGGTHRFEMTHFNLPSARIAPDGSRLEYVYDTELRLTEVRNEQGAVWRYEYDAVGNLVRETDFNGRHQTYRYDAARQLVERTNGAGQTIGYQRDDAGRVTESITSDGVTTFEYTPTGRMLRAVNADAVLEFSYDANGRLLSESCNGSTVTSTYDVLGRRITRVTPQGVASTWEYDERGLPTVLRVGDSTLSFSHDAGGREIQRGLGGTARLQQSWDVSGRLAGQTLTRRTRDGETGERLLDERHFTYRADGYPTGVSDRTSGSQLFTLDAVGRITGVTGTGEAAGTPGPVAASHAAGSEDRRTSGTRLTRTGRTRYAYDEQGRVVGRTRRSLSGGSRTWTYTWDAEDRMRSVTGPGGETEVYRYDPLGRRIAKRSLNPDGSLRGETSFVWDGEVLAEQTSSTGAGDAGPTLTWESLLGDVARPVAQIRSAPPGRADAADRTPGEDIDRRFHAIVTDLIGTPTELVSPDGDIAWRMRSTGRGDASVTAYDDVDCPLRFPGQYHDEETGLSYNYHRYYDPETDRYLSPDPLGLAPGPDDYAYVTNPLVSADPLGLSPCSGIINMFRGASQGLPGGQAGAAVSIRQVRMALGRAGMTVDHYDIVHVPEIRTPTGIAFGNSPHLASGTPSLGPRGLPLIQISDIGLRSMDEAVKTIFHEIHHHQQFRLSLNSRPLWGETVAPSHIWGGTEDAAEDYGRRMLDLFNARTR